VIIIRSPKEIGAIERSCQIVAEAFALVRGLIRPGISTGEICRLVEEFIERRGGKPAFKGYKGFPAGICTSVNEEVVHGIPGKRRLEEGDLISLDLGVFKDGYYGDAARTYPVGQVSPKAEKLIQITKEALALGIEKAQIDKRISDISHAIQVHVESAGFSVVRALCGHGIGSQMHEDPEIPNFGGPGHGPRIKPGMVLAIEPMVNSGDSEVFVRNDRWTVVTVDGSLSAHFEDTVAVTLDGPQILTRMEEEKGEIKEFLCQRKNQSKSTEL